MRLFGLFAQPSFAIRLVIGVVPFEPGHLAVTFKGENMGGDTVEEPAIV